MDVAYYRTELARKALDKLEALSADYDNKKIGLVTLRAGINAIWWICSGLVDKETMAVIELAHNEVEHLIKQRTGEQP